MVKIKPFRGIRPPQQFAAEVASRPYDVLNSAEAKQEATERSLLHIIKPEIDFDPIADEHSDEVYQKAMENFRLWKERGWLMSLQINFSWKTRIMQSPRQNARTSLPKSVQVKTGQSFDLLFHFHTEDWTFCCIQAKMC